MRQALHAFIQGHRQANQVTEAERMERLAKMTPHQARALFRELTASWEAVSASEQGLERLEAWRLETLIARRQAFLRLAQAKGYV